MFNTATPYSENNRDRGEPGAPDMEWSIEIGMQDVKKLELLAHRLHAGTPIFLNVLNSDRLDDRVAACRTIRDLGFEPVPHLAARRLSDRSTLREILHRLHAEAEVTALLVVSGDPDSPAGQYCDALELIDAIACDNPGVLRIGIAGYPEGHPAKTDARLAGELRAKLAAIDAMGAAPFVTLQFSFDADAIMRWCRAFHSEHPGVHIRVGLPGPASATTLIRYAHRCGIGVSLSKLKSLPLSNSIALLRKIPPVAQTRAVASYRRDFNSNVSTHVFAFGDLKAAIDFIDTAG